MNAKKKVIQEESVQIHCESVKSHCEIMIRFNREEEIKKLKIINVAELAPIYHDIVKEYLNSEFLGQTTFVKIHHESREMIIGSIFDENGVDLVTKIID